MTRAHIRLTTSNDVQKFINKVEASGNNDLFAIEDETGRHRVDARSFMGVIYAMMEFNDHMYLVNETNDGSFPHFVDEFRVL